MNHQADQPAVVTRALRTRGAIKAGMGIREAPFRGLINRLLQVLALHMPGATTLRVHLHRMRGVKIGKGTFIGMEVILESGYPQLVSIGDNVTISVRALFIAHFRGMKRVERLSNRPSIQIEDDVFIGPNVTILPNVTIGKGAVVTAGSVVSHSVPPMTMVQGNPARVIAKCEAPFLGSPYEEFRRCLRFVNAHRRSSQDTNPE